MNVHPEFAGIEEHLDQNLPLVLYKKQGAKHLNVLLQENEMIYEVANYQESGFVFSPFDQSKKAILLPLDVCKHITIPLTELPVVDEDVFYTKEQEIKISWSEEQKNKHKQLVQKGIDVIKAGAFKKVVLSRKEVVVGEEAFEPLLLLKRLINSYDDAFVYLWYHPKVGIWLGATPETLLYSKENKFSTMALAGTLPYQSTEQVNWGNKELEEQEMVTSFILEQLSGIANDIISSKTYTHKAGTLLHLRTDIKGDLIPEKSGLKDVLSILHPTPAVCGLPKNDAKEFILQNEGYSREYYTGFLGELHMQDGKGKVISDMYVNLRCMQLNGNEVELYVGGGVTKDSDPEKEWEETVRKTETMKKVLF
ncbi:isochorismate synthase [Aquimarina spongiae]|uniref:isochorismate synthase n=1 Tax=Aquimarina spongiae TaxID=570521 RepID=A0A1M6AMC3_9FLAO|nr:isochorismate synthase [Aquimarina spongiae]SHI37581.1 isochorismate synthase [Aquimarina spongiae]